MSDIQGSGYGASHDWQYFGTSPSRYSTYKCRACGVVFFHHYDSTPDIFKAIKQTVNDNGGIPDKCPIKERNDGRRTIDKQRAVQHYSDQQRIAELEKTVFRIEHGWAILSDEEYNSDRMASLEPEGNVMTSNVEQLLEQWREGLDSKLSKAIMPPGSDAHIMLDACIKELESAIQRDKEQS